MVPTDSNADVHTLPHNQQCDHFVWFCAYFVICYFDINCLYVCYCCGINIYLHSEYCKQLKVINFFWKVENVQNISESEECRLVGCDTTWLL
jgi:hypothetical protein